MKVIGSTHRGATPFELAADTKRVVRYTVAVPVNVVKLSVYVDGLGSGSGDQAMRGIIYGSDGSLIAQGDEVIVHDGQTVGWVDLPFSVFSGGVRLSGGADYDLGVLGGTNSKSARVYGDNT